MYPATQMTDSVQIFIELGQRVEGLQILSHEKKVAEATTLRSWTAEDLVLMKEGIVEYLRDLLSTNEIKVKYSITIGHSIKDGEVIIKEGSTVNDLFKVIRRIYNLSDLYELGNAYIVGPIDSKHVSIPSNTLLKNGMKYNLAFAVHEIPIKYVDRQGRTHTYNYLAKMRNTIEDVIIDAQEWADEIEGDEDAGDSYYQLWAGNAYWRELDTEYIYEKWVEAGKPELRLDRVD